MRPSCAYPFIPGCLEASMPLAGDVVQRVPCNLLPEQNLRDGSAQRQLRTAPQWIAETGRLLTLPLAAKRDRKSAPRFLPRAAGQNAPQITIDKSTPPRRRPRELQRRT